MCYCSNWHGEVESLLPTIPDSLDFHNSMVIFGSRSYSGGSIRDRATEIVEWINDSRLSRPDLIISGGANGADAAAEAVSITLGVPAVIMTVGGPSDDTLFRHELAKERDIPWVVDETTEWDGDYGPAEYGAPLIRNCAMAVLVSQLDGSAFGIHKNESPGTSRMLTSLADHGVEDVVRKVP